jgi:hypothetical protein
MLPHLIVVVVGHAAERRSSRAGQRLPDDLGLLGG